MLPVAWAQLLAANQEGSAGVLNYDIYALTDRTLELLARRGPIYAGKVRAEDGTLVESDGEVLAGTWDGVKFAWENVTPVPVTGDVVVAYDVSTPDPMITARAVDVPIGHRLFMFSEKRAPKVAASALLEHEYATTFVARQLGSGRVTLSGSSAVTLEVTVIP